MADTKISALTSGNPAQSTDEIPIARSGANYKITAGSIAALGGDVDGPASSVDNQIALFDSTTGKLIKAASTTGLLKASSGVIAAASSGTDYAPATTGTSAQLLANSGSGGFANVNVGSGLTLAAGTLSASGGSGTVTSVAFSTGTTGLSVTGSPITTSGTITLAGTLGVANGGTGATTLTGLVKGSGTSAFSAATAGTDYVAPAGAFSGLSWQSVQTTGFTAVAFRAYPCNTTSAAFTVTLPASPSAGDQITLTDYAGTWATNNLTINPNGGKVNGSTSNYVVSQNRWSFQLVYVDSTQGWLIYGVTNLFIPAPTSVDYLVVGGGGGGNNYSSPSNAQGGGGGAGGFRKGGLSVTAGTSYTITVGAAGAVGSNGNDSIFSSITSTGGGRGGTNSVTANTGGSGGGGSGNTNTTGAAGNTPSTSPSQGNAGGNGSTGPSFRTGGGGGGAGGTGENAVADTRGGNGGTGSLGPSFANGFGKSGDSTSGSGDYFAGGGGGSSAPPGTAGTGGTGGGGAGGVGSTAANAGAANTGSGGGASNLAVGGSGGSGVVIIAYPSIYAAAAATTGSPTVTISGGNRIYAFTGNGSITF